jgi:hypothetical protein
VLPDRSQDWVGCLTPPALSFLAALFLGHGFAFLLLVQAVTHFELLLLRANRHVHHDFIRIDIHA